MVGRGGRALSRIASRAGGHWTEWKSGSTNREPVVTWEFPILAKYRFTLSRVRPFIEAGPSFRTAGNLNGTNPSHYGFTAGAGAEMHLKQLNVAPVLRYTRWAEDGVTPYQAQSSPNQLELAAGVNKCSDWNGDPLGMRFSVGALVGTGLTDDVRTTGFAFASGVQFFSETTSPRRGVTGGPMLELRLPAHFSVEADALYAPLRFNTVTASSGTSTRTYSGSIGNWDIPVLAKWRLPVRLVSPFIEGGPAFRIGTGELSHEGVTAGVGLEAHFHALRIAPTFRYSHWAAGTIGSTSIRNQVEFLAAFYL